MTDGTEVWVELDGRVVRVGTLWSSRRRRTESATFAYEASYLADRAAYALAPALPLAQGPFATASGSAMFAAFSDCAPDRWGRRLIDRSEQARVRSVGDGAARSFGEAEYLLGVRDDLRQGALRFRARDGTWLASEDDGIPHLVDLPVLLDASDRIERDDASADDLRVLLRGGSSLGGARPKAHVRAADGRISIAKFPSPSSDDWDVMRWEAVALRLARSAGIDAVDGHIHEVDGRPVLVVGRFDRAGDHRIGFVSAMTMLERTDGEHGTYLDIAEQIEEHSPQATRDLHELWRRIVFGVLISNTDDHLRNHGFLRREVAGWSLSPAFDLNPDPRPGRAMLSTSIDGETDDASLDAALAVADAFRLDRAGAVAIVREVSRATSRWREVAGDQGLSRSEADGMERAFEHDRAVAAREF